MLRVLYCENRSCGKQIKPVVMTTGFTALQYFVLAHSVQNFRMNPAGYGDTFPPIFRILFRAGLRRARVSKLPQACPRCLHCKTRWLAAMNPLPQLLRIAKTFSLAGSGSSGSGHLMRAHQSAHAQH